MPPRPELHRLSVPFPAKMVAQKQGASYVNHGVVRQRLLGTLGPFTQRVDHIIRGDFDAKTTGSGKTEREWPARTNAVVGVVLTCVFTIDGKTVEVSEVGTPEGYYMADHDGDRLKKAVSDAVKRCAMSVGVALDLWSKGAYFLPAMTAVDVDPATGEITVEEQAADTIDHDAPEPDDAESSPAEPEPDLSPGWTTRARGDAPAESAAGGQQVDWTAIAKECGITPAKILTISRRIAKEMGLDQPRKVDDITAPELVGRVLTEAGKA